MLGCNISYGAFFFEKIQKKKTYTTKSIRMRLTRKHSEGEVRICPHCGTYCGTIHDYREQRVKDIPAFGKEGTHMVTETLKDSETVFYIYSHINEQPSCHSKYLIATSKVYFCW